MENFSHLKVLINIRSLTFEGGVVQIFKVLELNKFEKIEYFEISNPKNSGNPFYLLFVYIKFFLKARYFNIIHLNPSFRRNSLWRDWIFLKIAKILNKKVVVFFHGWDDKYEENILKSKFSLALFKSFNRVDAFILLGKRFKEKLIRLGISENKKFYFESTIADDTYVETFNLEKKLKNFRLKKEFYFLFISRIVKNKGMDLALDIFKILQAKLKHLNLYLIFAGDGDMLNWTKQYALNNNIKNVEFKGFVHGKLKNEIFLTSDFLLFPSYSEGLPNSIMESCLYGLPIITKNVGGIGDWIINGENGFVSSSNDPLDYASFIENLINDPDLYCNISTNNFILATNNFTPSKVKERLLQHYQEVQNAN